MGTPNWDFLNRRSSFLLSHTDGQSRTLKKSVAFPRSEREIKRFRRPARSTNRSYEMKTCFLIGLIILCIASAHASYIRVLVDTNTSTLRIKLNVQGESAEQTRQVSGYIVVSVDEATHPTRLQLNDFLLRAEGAFAFTFELTRCTVYASATELLVREETPLCAPHVYPVTAGQLFTLGSVP